MLFRSAISAVAALIAPAAHDGGLDASKSVSKLLSCPATVAEAVGLADCATICSTKVAASDAFATGATVSAVVIPARCTCVLGSIAIPVPVSAACPVTAEVVCCAASGLALVSRSEERRVGKECRAGGAPDH